MSKLEHSEQVELFKWAAKVAYLGFELAEVEKLPQNPSRKPVPEISLMFAIPNGGSRGDSALSRQIRGNQLKAEGVKSGVPDIFLPVGKRGYNGLFIELKRADKRKSRVSENQDDFIPRLREQGFCAEVCYGAEHAKELIKWYFSVGNENDIF